MNIEVRSADRPDMVADPRAKARRALGSAQRAAAADRAGRCRGSGRRQAADHSAADADQTFSDADQTASTADQASAEQDQIASDRDQASADRDQANHDLQLLTRTLTPRRAKSETWGRSIASGTASSVAARAHDRDVTADQRDQVAETRDDVGRARDVRVADLTRASSEPEATLMRQLEELAAKAAADRARAAADRARAAGIGRRPPSNGHGSRQRCARPTSTS